MLRVKICGMTSCEDVEACVAAGADALGFIFGRSARRLTIDDAAALTARVPPFVTTVGVFAGDPAEAVRSAVARCRLDVLQFSGDEPPEFCGAFGKPTILAARGRALDETVRARARAIAVLADSWSAHEFGGTGRRVDPELFRAIRAASGSAWCILAGGLTPDNVGAAIRAVAPDGVDVRSGVERAGMKDPQLVRAFVRAARSAAM